MIGFKGATLFLRAAFGRGLAGGISKLPQHTIGLDNISLTVLEWLRALRPQPNATENKLLAIIKNCPCRKPVELSLKYGPPSLVETSNGVPDISQLFLSVTETQKKGLCNHYDASLYFLNSPSDIGCARMNTYEWDWETDLNYEEWKAGKASIPKLIKRTP